MNLELHELISLNYEDESTFNAAFQEAKTFLLNL